MSAQWRSANDGDGGLFWPRRASERLVWGGFLLLCCATAATQVFDWDIFWQLQSGQYLWQTKTFVRSDLFTLAASAPRWEHCWLHDLLFYAAWSCGGFVAMGLLKGLLLTTTGVLTCAVARVRGASWSATLLAVPTLFFLSAPWWQDRPQLWSFLGMVLTLLLVERYRFEGGRNVLWLIPLAIVWANLHAGVLLLVPLLTAALVGRWGENWLKGERQPWRSWLWPAFAGAVLAFVATPYGGADWWRAVENSAQGAASGVELLAQNLDFAAWQWRENLAFAVVASGTVVLLFSCRRHLHLRDLLLLGGLALMGFRLSRHLPFFFLATAALLPRYLDVSARELAKHWPRLQGMAGRRGIVAAAFILLLLGASGAIRAYGLFDLGMRRESFPVAAATFIAEERLPGNLFNAYEWGGYLAWRLYPSYQVFWDGRQDSAEMFRYGMQVMGGVDWQRILDRYGVNVIVIPPCHMVTGGRQALILDPLRASTSWTLVCAEAPAVVYVRNTAVDPDWLLAHRLDDRQVDDVSLKLTDALLRRDGRQYRAYGERARIFLARGDVSRAYSELKKYFTHCPPGKRDRDAVRIYQELDRRARM